MRWSSTLTFIKGSFSSPRVATRGLCYVPHKSSSCFTITPLCLGTQLICQAELAGKFFSSETETVINSLDGVFGLLCFDVRWPNWPVCDDRRALQGLLWPSVLISGHCLSLSSRLSFLLYNQICTFVVHCGSTPRNLSLVFVFAKFFDRLVRPSERKVTENYAEERKDFRFHNTLWTAIFSHWDDLNGNLCTVLQTLAVTVFWSCSTLNSLSAVPLSLTETLSCTQIYWHMNVK